LLKKQRRQPPSEARGFEIRQGGGRAKL
jgi:hypothetical protein